MNVYQLYMKKPWQSLPKCPGQHLAFQTSLLQILMHKMKGKGSSPPRLKEWLIGIDLYLCLKGEVHVLLSPWRRRADRQVCQTDREKPMWGRQVCQTDRDTNSRRDRQLCHSDRQPCRTDIQICQTDGDLLCLLIGTDSLGLQSRIRSGSEEQQEQWYSD